MLLFFTAMSHYDLLLNNNFWQIAALTAATLTILLFLTGINKSMASKLGQALIMLLFSVFYGAGTTILVNCGFDRSLPPIIHTVIKDKHTTYSKGRHYHLVLQSWDSNSSPNIEVSLSTYNSYHEGGAINVYLRNGTLNIPWFSIYH